MSNKEEGFFFKSGGGRGSYKNYYRDFKSARKLPDFSIVICLMYYYNRKG